MTDRELRKLSRSDLLEMLIDLSEAHNLVKQQLKTAEEKLNNRQILIDKAGSIAEASLQLNGVFEAAEAAGEQYMESIRSLSERQDEICRRIELECREKAKRRLEEVERKCMQMEADTIAYCSKMKAMAEAENETARLSAKQEEICRRIELECREKAKRQLEEVERKCMQMEADTITRCAKLQAMARSENPIIKKYATYGARV